MGAPRVTAGGLASWDVDKAQSCGGWIVWRILGRYNLTLNCVKPWWHGGGTRPPGTWMRPKDAVDGLSGKFWAAMTWLYLGHAPPIKRLPLSNFTPKQIELESRGWSQFFANCLLFLKNTKVLNFSLFLHKKIDAFKDNIINAKVSLNTILHNLNEPDSHCFLHLGKPFYTGFCRKKCIF